MVKKTPNLLVNWEKKLAWLFNEKFSNLIGILEKKPSKLLKKICIKNLLTW